MPARFVYPVATPTENSFTAQGIHFEYLTLDPDTEARLRLEANDWQIDTTIATEISHDEYGDHFGGTRQHSRRLTEINTLSKPVSFLYASGDIIVEEGRVVGVVIYTGKDTDRYGYKEVTPINADPYYHLEKWMIRPSEGEVVPDFTIFYTDGRVLGNATGYYTAWDSREIEYHTIKFALTRADQITNK